MKINLPPKTEKVTRATHAYPRYSIRPFYGMLDSKIKSEEPTGWDVWEETSPTSEAIISPCDTREEAERELVRIQKL